MNFIRLVKHDLPGEARSWVQNGLITQPQAEQILAQYGVVYDERGSRLQALSVLSVLGLLFIGLGFLVVVGRNWEEIPPYLRLAVLFLGTVSSNVRGIFAWQKGEHEKASNYLLFGSLIYGASIFLIAQTFHLSGYAPEGVLWWAIGIVPLLVGTGHLRFAFLLTVLSTIYLVMEGADGYIPWMYLPLAAIVFRHILAVRESKILYFALLAGFVFFSGTIFQQSIAYYFPYDAAMIHVHAGLCLLTVVTMLASYAKRCESFTDYLAVTRLWLVRLGFVLLFALSFDECWKAKRYFDGAAPECMMWVTCGVVSLWGLLFAGERLKVTSRSLHPIDHAAVWTGAVLTVLWCSDLTSAEVRSMLAIFVNVIIVGFAAWIIAAASGTGRSSRVLAGAGIISVLGVVRYIDFVGDYMGAAALFTAEGIALYSIAKVISLRGEAKGI